MVTASIFTFVESSNNTFIILLFTITTNKKDVQLMRLMDDPYELGPAHVLLLVEVVQYSTIVSPWNLELFF